MSPECPDLTYEKRKGMKRSTLDQRRRSRSQNEERERRPIGVWIKELTLVVRVRRSNNNVTIRKQTLVSFLVVRVGLQTIHDRLPSFLDKIYTLVSGLGWFQKQTSFFTSKLHFTVGTESKFSFLINLQTFLHFCFFLC